jgi:hypothetical protein
MYKKIKMKFCIIFIYHNSLILTLSSLQNYIIVNKYIQSLIKLMEHKYIHYINKQIQMNKNYYC